MSRLFEWHNLMFALALLIGAVLVLGSALGLLSAEASLDAEHDAEHADASGTLLAALGIGRAPLAVFVITALLAFGAAGVSTDFLLERWVASPISRGALALFAALVSGFVVARGTSKLVARFVPSLESYASAKDELVGTTGVAELSIARDFGIARVLDGTGTPMKIKCQAYGEPIAKGSEILVVDYDPERDVYTVESNPSEER